MKIYINGKEATKEELEQLAKDIQSRKVYATAKVVNGELHYEIY